MMTRHRHWWRRLTERVRGTRTRGPDELPDVGTDGLLIEPAGDRDEAGDKEPGALARWTRRDSTLAQLQEGYERVTRLMGDIQAHMAGQSERSERICAAIEQLSRTMAPLPETALQQTRTLDTIAGQLEVSASTSRQLAEAIGQIPKLTRTQGDTLAGINRQLEMMGEQSVLGNQATEKLQAAIGHLGQTGQVQTEILKHMDRHAGEEHRVLVALLTGQGRRLTILLVATMVLAVGALAAAIAALVLGLKP